jgi:hypothetical protein
MKLDDTAATYGLVQVVFADVTDHLAFAIFRLRQAKGTAVNFQDIVNLKFGYMVSNFKTELRQFTHPQPPDDARDEVGIADLNEVCKELKALSKWRNDRIHARVRWVEDGLALYNGKTGERLSINHGECTEVLNRLVKAIVKLDTYVPELVRSLDFNNEFEGFCRECFVDMEVSTGEGQNGTPAPSE